ncbi:GT2 family glycosyltransferase [Novosphingobium sp. SG751A]|uniref:glycosyltransferase n=1 Tax=Novosphingobium sp. SG751A TaxID=2587000 RepID=UPI001555881A|nr:glycosyltransferase [Novosphingobium sp. SG751A]NOW46448.1 GT2 family glycosyltransferase [Novosphingobium sp. SG751A]
MSPPPTPSLPSPALGVVVIGRNEAARLPGCLASIIAHGYPIIYVDSGSTDGSADLARAMGCSIVELAPEHGFTAARARNAGFARLRSLDPAVVLVQFIDGDCEMVDGWPTAAIATLLGNPRIAAVCGRRRERHPHSSPYNRLCDLEWNTSLGETHSCGGDALVRADAFAAVGGFCPSLIAGEEPELCFRLRQAGWTIHRIADEMTLHDAAMDRFGQWWKRNRRNGHAIAQAFSDPARDDPGLRRTFISNIVWALPLAWPLWPLLWWRIFQRHDAQTANLMVLAKLPHFLGQLAYFMKAKKNNFKIIEYK